MKRLFDFVSSLIGIIITSPIFILVSVAIKLDSKGPVIFKQRRVGYQGRIFEIYKFRSMIVNAENLGAGIYFEGENDPRFTKVGKFIRKTSLDELPQLLNIIKGDMSIVGPRPLLPVTIEQMNNYQKRRLEKKPGVTGWAQVNGRNELSMKERIERDIWYIDHYSFWLDIKIIFKTIKVVFRKEGIKVDQKKEHVEIF